MSIEVQLYAEVQHGTDGPMTVTWSWTALDPHKGSANDPMKPYWDCVTIQWDNPCNTQSLEHSNKLIKGSSSVIISAIFIRVQGAYAAHQL